MPEPIPTGEAAAAIPPLVSGPSTIPADESASAIERIGTNGTGPKTAGPLVTAGAFIERTIGTSGTVAYGDAEIGVAGSIARLADTE
jgi:hypothetical protein